MNIENQRTIVCSDAEDTLYSTVFIYDVSHELSELFYCTGCNMATDVTLYKVRQCLVVLGLLVDADF